MNLLAMGVLLPLLVVACWQDYGNYQIRNTLVLAGALLGISLNTLLFASTGTLDSLTGCGIGLLLLLPFYLLRVMGAGDVKLMAMVGAFVGPTDILGIFLSTLIAGGMLALIVSLHKGMLRRLLENIIGIFIRAFRIDKSSSLQDSLPVSDTTAGSVGKLPYAIAITLGTVAFLIIEQPMIY